jgi:4-hydroxy-tetrahydrodipicolinate synthase
MTRRPEGVICPIATPFINDAEKLDEPAFRQLIDFVLPSIDGLLVLGTTGEFALLTESTAYRAVEVAVEQVAGRIPIYVGIGDTGTERVLEKLRTVEQLAVDYVLVTAPFYFSVSNQAALYRHFTKVAEASTLPLLVYNIQNTHNNLTPALMAELAAHPNIVGLKDSWGDFYQFQEFLALRSDKFSVFMGPEQLFAASLWLGADGLVSALANIVPRVFKRLIAQVKAGERQAAIQTQREITRLADIFKFGTVAGAIKVVLDDLGTGSRRVAAPLPQCSEAQVDQIRQVVARSNILQEEPHV